MPATAATYENISWSPDCLVPQGPPLQPEISKRIKAQYGYIPEFASGFALVPWLLDGIMRFNEMPVVHITHQMKDMVMMIVSQDSSCRYCYGISRSLLQISGMADKQIRQLEQDLYAADMPIDRKAALEYIRKLSRANPRPGAQEEEGLLEAGWGKEAVTEVAFMAAEAILFNRAMTLSAAQPAPLEGMSKGLRGMLFKPIMKRQLSKRPIGQKVPLGDANGPYGGIVRIADGLPGALTFRVMIDGAMSSGILPRRSKAIILAVIARMLLCDACEREAVRILAEEGFSEEDSKQMLEKLSSPLFDEKEAKMAPIARHTVRAQPAEMQGRMNELRGVLTPAEFVEFIGVASLGNALSRLSCLLDRC